MSFFIQKIYIFEIQLQNNMGNIISTKRLENGKVSYEVCLDYDEMIRLQGHMEGIYLFSDNISDIKTKIAGRGKNQTTMYFLIPKQFRKDLSVKGDIHCQKIETKSKIAFIYTLDKY